ncbi:sensor histidine kinase [Amnibacterium flavum]|uniref:Histidine kinase/HSP90-like ATPase domain-containing protein n=1 Tax=Amnibacterium flavum TaxID=2173173 RepID=A0A2V1HYG4_9MICO|nr:hypothetical protein DDQ50_03270 [Amnibacterium flavum]
MMLPNTRAATTTNRGIAAGSYWFAMILLVAGATSAAMIASATGEWSVTLWVVAGFALVAAAGSMLRWAYGAGVVLSAVIVGAAGIALTTWQIAVVAPGPISTDTYFFSTITVATVTFGTLVWRSGHAALACTVAILLAQTIFGLAAFITGGQWAVDLPSLIIWAILFLVLTALESARKSGRRAAAAFERADASQAETSARRRIALQSTAVLHDTVLGDLTTLATTEPGTLNARTIARLADTIALLTSGDWLGNELETPIDDRLAQLIDPERLADVEVSIVGDGAALDLLRDEDARELIRALDQCLDNVDRHARAKNVEVVLMSSAEEISVMVNDDGVGFDLASLDPARLGLRASVQARLEAIGGRSTIWSTPGSGTSVLLTVPIRQLDDPVGQNR